MKGFSRKFRIVGDTPFQPKPSQPESPWKQEPVIITDLNAQTGYEISFTTSWQNIDTKEVTKETLKFVYWVLVNNGEAGTKYFQFRIYDGTNYYPNETNGIVVGAGPDQFAHTYVEAPGNFDGKSVILQGRVTGGSTTDTEVEATNYAFGNA